MSSKNFGCRSFVSFLTRLPELTIEELEAYIADPQIGQCAPLTRELSAKVLMRALNGLSRQLALTLVTPSDKDPRATAGSDPLAEELSAIFVRCQLSEAQLWELIGHCSEAGAKVWRRACAKYMKDPVFKAREINVQELLLHVEKEMGSATPDGGAWDGAKAKEAADAFADDFEDPEQIRQELLRLGIESAKDWALMLDALRCVAKEDPKTFNTPGIASRNTITRKARELKDLAKLQGSTPSAIIAWKKIKRKIGTKDCLPNEIHVRPDGSMIYGDGTPVIRDKNGNLRRRVATIFGTPMAANEVPDVADITRKVNSTFG